MALPRFYPVLDDVAWLRRVLPLGVKLVQLRIKELSGDALTDQIAQARDLCRARARPSWSTITGVRRSISAATGSIWARRISTPPTSPRCAARGQDRDQHA